ncbi:MAG: serine-type D-Ala-D-Ala carboxypeptidase [Cellvibrionales bacterium TMED122]|nr:serine-type D-Ala-D-Ala carboxypeptidase [Halieaceae bacterium]OUV62745.1 MAG: serine-type D-Ala-D-Ala carboxypeptidase [Cellvibrionales bacterium TMED122]
MQTAIRIRRYWSAWLFGAVLLPSVVLANTALVPSPPSINADSYFLVDFDTGAVMVEHNPDLQLPPASLTKLMTAYILAEEVALGRLALEDTVRVSPNAWSQNPVFNGSSLMWIEPGKPVTVAELERGIVISSGNDATVAIAEHIAGSEAAFVDLMNRYAEEMGLTRTRFENSHGLPHPDHLSTARDLAATAVAAIRDHPERYAVYKEQSYTYNDITQYNRNHLLREDPSVDGLKTGYTRVAGYGLVASAEREGMRLVSVVMGSSSTASRKAETRSLLNYGFRFFETLRPLTPEASLSEAQVWKGQSKQVTLGVTDEVVLTLPRSIASIDTQVEVDEPLVAPLDVNDVVGRVTLLRDGEVVSEVPLRVLQRVEPAGFFARLWDTIVLWFQQLLG